MIIQALEWRIRFVDRSELPRSCAGDSTAFPLSVHIFDILCEYRFEPLYGLHQKREAEAKARAAEQKMRNDYLNRSSHSASSAATTAKSQAQKRPGRLF